MIGCHHTGPAWLYLGSGGSRRELQLVGGSGSQGHGQIRRSNAQSDALATVRFGRGDVMVEKNSGAWTGIPSPPGTS